MQKHLLIFRSTDLFRAPGIAILLLLGSIMPNHVFAGNAANGEGTMTVTPAAVCAGNTGNSYVFTFTKPSGDFNSGSQTTLVIPSGWTAPQNTLSGSPGYISVTATGSGSIATIASISGTGPWTITINMTLTASGSYFTLTYGGGGTAVTNASAGSYTFTTKTKQNGGTLTNIVSQPVITTTALPIATFSYTGSPYCKNASNPSPTFSGGGVSGTFSSTAGLVFVSTSTGQVNLTSSTPGTYTVTNTIAAAGGCAVVTASTSITITALPVATFSYTATPYCQNTANPSPTFSGGGVAGIFSSTAGLVFVSTATGQVNLSASTPGTYTVTNTIAGANGCAQVTATSSIIITAFPTASISYSSTPFCKSIATGQAVTLTGTGAYTGGTYTASPAGLTINISTGAITPGTSTAGIYSVSYTVPASGGCAALPITTSATITAVPSATVNYAGTPFCRSVSTAQPVTLSGTGAYTGGAFSATEGLDIDGSSGEIIPGTGTSGTFTVTYMIPASGGCAAVPVTTSVTTTDVPTAAINYPGSPFCTSLASAQPVSLTGTGAYTGGTFSSTSGLTINSSSGDITPGTSTDGNYLVTYTVPASGGCDALDVTASVDLFGPTATISYSGSPFCTTVSTPQSVTLTGTGSFTGGTFSAPAGLTIDGSTGEIIPGTSTADTYTVTYTIPGTGSCADVLSTTSVTLTEMPIATFSYTSTPYCSNESNPSPTFSGGGVAGTFSSTAGLVFVSTSTGQVNLTSSTPGTYTVTNTIAAAGGCAVVTASGSITITALPVATFSYTATPYCQSATNPSPTFSGGGVAGTFSSTAGLVFVSTATGQVNLSASTPGTYTVTNTIAAANGCAQVTATSPITVTAVPTASISFTGTPFCKSIATGQAVTLTGTGAYTGGTYTASPAGLTINSSTGAITPGTSTAGTYTITYTVAASGGCAALPVTNSATITAVPTATVNYAGTPFCKSLSGAQPVTLTGTGAYTAGAYSSTAGLTLDGTLGDITPGTSTAGTYTVTYTIPASAGCAAVPATKSITITAIPVATFSYTATPYCKNASNPSPTFSGGGVAGTFSSTAGLVFVSTSTGQVNLTSSTPGTYTVTNTIAAAGGCVLVAASASITITALPVVTFSYTATPYCQSATNPSPTFSGGGVAGTFSSTVGLVFVSTATGQVNLSASTPGTYTVTNTIAAANGCAQVTATSPINITVVPMAGITYTGTPYCKSIATGQAVTLTGTGAYTGGTYTAAPAGLIINSSTGAITPSTSTAGTFTITYTVPASGGCVAVPVTTTATITSVPTATINYAGTPFCKSLSGTQPVTLTGTAAYTGGAYTSTAGITLNGTTGDITPGTSTAGTYTVTYTIPASAGCAAVPATKSVTITAVPTAAISYAGTPFCKSLSTGQAVTLSGTGAYTGGVYTSAAGLSINSSSGAITPSSSTAGPYTVTYTVPASGGCVAVPVTTSVTVTATPTATISYAGTPFCASVSTAQAVTLSGTNSYTGGTFSAPAGLTINSTSGDIIPNTSTAGTRTVTYTIPASAGCAATPVTTSVTINSVPTATISYAGAPFCTTTGAKTVALTGTGLYTGGTYSAPAGLTINAANGTITPGTSTAGTYTVTYTTTTSSGCAAQNATTSVTITAQPVATFSYTGNPYYTGVSNPLPAFSGGGQAGTFSSTAGLVFVSTSTGQVNLAASTPGTYIVTNTIAASGGCAAVSDTGLVSIVVDFRSATSGNWNNVSSWETYNGSTWSPAATTPNSNSGTITIRSGHTITVTASVTVDQVTIDAGGQVTLSTGTFTVNDGTGKDVIVNGTLDVNSLLTMNALSKIEINGTGICRSSGNITIVTTANITVESGGLFRKDGGTVSTNGVTNWTIDNGGTYRHNQDGTIIPEATWDSSSTLEITGVVSNLPSQFNQFFGNLTWNSPAQTATVNMVNDLQTINGHFTMTSTGTGALQLTSSSSNITYIGKNYIHNGGKLIVSQSGAWVINVAGDFTMSGGSLIMNDATAALGDGNSFLIVFGNTTVTGGTVDMSQYTGSNSNKGISIWRLYKDFTFTGGTFLSSSTGTGYGLIQFAGTNTQNYIGTTSFGSKVDFQVLGAATLNLSTYILSGGRNFTLDAQGSILLKNPNGITKTALSGNVQTLGTRTYSTDGLYTYNGTSAQVTGDGLPPIVNSLTVDNPAGATLSRSVIANYNLNMLSGNITTLNDTLGLGFNNSNTGVLTRTTTMIYGYFKRWIRSNFTGGYLFPLGYNNAYRGMQINYTATASTGDYVLGYYTPQDPGNYGFPLTEDGITFNDPGPEGWWNLFPYGSIASGGEYTLDLYSWGYPGLVDYTKLRIVRRVNTLSPWTFTGTHLPGTGSNLYAIAHRANLSVYGQFDVMKYPGAPLPVELVDFTAKLVDEKVLVNWKTATEINNDYFTVERSRDGITYTTVAKRPGAGTSSQANFYYAVDNNPMPGVSYYRLKQTDFDGKETIYPPIAVNLKLLQNIVIFPNPSNGNTTYIAFPNNFSESIAIEVTDLAGKRIFSRIEYPQGNTVTELDPRKLLRPGAYFVTITLSNEAIVQRVVISE